MWVGVCVHMCMLPLLLLQDNICVLNISIQSRWLLISTCICSITWVCIVTNMERLFDVLLCLLNTKLLWNLLPFWQSTYIQNRSKESKQKFEIIYSSSMVFTYCSLQFDFATCSQKSLKIARNFCSCPCMLYLPSRNLHPGHCQHIFNWRGL